MNRHDVNNAAEKIAGYYFPSPSEECMGNYEDAFMRAQEEAARNLKNMASYVEALSFDEYLTSRKLGGSKV